MADSLITIKIKLENLGLKDNGGKSSGSSGGTAASIPDLNLDEIRKAFSDLSKDIRSISSSLSSLTKAAEVFKQVSQDTAKAAGKVKTTSSTTGTPSTPKESPGGKPAGGTSTSTSTAPTTSTSNAEAAAQDKATTAAKDKTAATLESAAADEKAAATARAKASAEAEAADKLEVTQATLEMMQKRAQAFALSGQNAARAAELMSEKTKSAAGVTGKLADEVGGRQSSLAKFIRNIIPVSEHEAFKRRAEGISSSVKKLFKVDKGATDEFASRANEAMDAITGQIKAAVERLDTGIGEIDTDNLLKSLQSNIDKTIKRFGLENTRFFDRQTFRESFQARAFTNETNSAREILKQVDAARTSGASEVEIGNLISKFEGVFSRIENLVARETSPSNTRGNRNTFLVPDPEGGRGARIDFQSELNKVIAPGTSGRQLTDVQRRVVDVVKQLSQTSGPLDIAREAFRVLATDANNLEENLIQVSASFKELSQSSVGGPEAFARFQEASKLLNVRRDRSGRITSPTAAGSDASTIFAARQVSDFRAEAAANLSRGEESTRMFNTTDSLGNIRRIQVGVKKLNDDLGTLRLTAKEVSDNMFDRASVRTALTRVATWGAAAGIVYTAVSGFKKAVDIVVSTEASIVSLAKVMDESKIDFEGFKRSARDAAITIAQEFGQPLEQVLNTMVLFGQQGLSFPEVESLSAASSLAAVVTTLDQETAASALTAATQQFGVDTRNATSIVDKFNSVANNAAVTEDQLAEAMKRAGIAARNAGVGIDEFNGIVAAISEQTRQTGSEIGTALRFIFSRLNTDEAERGLSQVGISVKDAQGNIRPFSELIGELKGRFDSLSSAQQNQVAISVAGARRFNTFLALIQNFDRYMESTQNSVNSAGSALAELANVEDTAAFKLQKLQNSLAGAAVSFGDIFLGPLKLATDGLSGFLDVLSDVPNWLQATLLATGAAGVGFAKFSQFFVDIADTAALGGGAGILGTVAGSFTQGTSLASQQHENPANALRVEAARNAITAGGANVSDLSSVGTAAALTVGDVAGFKKQEAAVKGFTSALKEQGLVLLDNKGKALESQKGITKFTAVSRNFRVASASTFSKLGEGAESAALSVAALNNPFSKVLSSVVRLSNKVLGLTFILPKVFDKAESKIASTGEAAGKLAFTLGSVVRVASAAALVFLAYKAGSAFFDAATETGEDVEKRLSSEIALRQKAINALKEQQGNLRTLSDDQRRAATLSARIAVQDPAITRERIRRGEYTSPRLRQEELNESRQRAINAVGFANPELIKSIDDFGNVVLKSATAFDTLAQSAVTAEERVQALTQLKIAEGFANDILPDDTFAKKAGRLIAAVGDSFTFGLTDFEESFKNAQEKLDEALAEARRYAGDRRNDIASDLGIGVELIDSDFAKDQSKSFGELSKRASEYEIALSGVEDKIKAMPENTADLLFSNERVTNILDRAAAARSTLTGRDITGGEIGSRLVLQNSSALPDRARALIRDNAFDTKESFNEAGFLNSVVDLSQKTAGEIKTTLGRELQGGDFVVFDSLFGSRQGTVEVNELGERVVKTLNAAGDSIEKIKLSELIDTAGVEKIFKFIPDAIKQQIDRSLLEIGRVATGAARGNILKQDIDLGVERSFELSGQQRASLRDENLFKDLIAAQRALATRRETLTGGNEDNTEAAITTDVVDEVRKLSEEFDRIATITRYRAEIENVNSSFEKAVDGLKKTNLADLIRSQFTVGLGAAATIPSANYQRPLLESQLNADQLSARRSPEIVRAGNQLIAAQKVVADAAVASAEAERRINAFLSDFKASREAGGVLDPSRLSQIAESALSSVKGGLEEGSALSLALLEQQVNIEEQQLSVLQQLLSQGATPREIGTSLAAAVDNATLSRDSINNIAARVSDVSGEDLRQFDTADINTLREKLGPASPANLIEEYVARRAEEAGNRINQTLARLGSFSQGSRSPNAGSFSDIIREFRALSRSSGRSRGDLGELSRAILSAARDSGTGVFGNSNRGISDDSVKQIISGAVDNLERAGIDSSVVDSLREQLKSNNAEFIGQFKDIILSIGQEFSGAEEPSPAREPRSPEEEASAARQEEKSRRELLKLNNLQKDSLQSTIAYFDLLSRAAAEAAVSLSNNLVGAAEDIALKQRFSTLVPRELTGALAGTTSLSFNTGADERSLSGAQVTQRQNQNLILAANEIAAASEALQASAVSVAKQITQTQAIREEALSKGDSRGVAEADRQLEILGNTMNLLSSKTRGTNDTIKKLGDSFRNLDAVNQFKQDIDGLLESFNKQRSLEFDRTSIDSALGNTVFSLLRPTFEQFEQGQAGFATAFDRAIADIGFKERQGQLSPQEASRERDKARFQQDEGIIQLAQQRENKRLQVQVDTAEQVRSRLLDFASSGGPGSAQAQSLFKQLTRGLESAGDIVQSSVSSRSIRNPLTGQREDVPASQILAFRGIPGLERVQQQVQSIARQVKEEEQSKSAALISNPIVNTLEQTSAEANKLLAEISKNTEGKDSLAADIKKENASTELQTALPDLIKFFRGGTDPTITADDAVLLNNVQKTVKDAISTYGQKSTSEAFSSLYAVNASGDRVNAVGEIRRAAESPDVDPAIKNQLEDILNSLRVSIPNEEFKTFTTSADAASTSLEELSGSVGTLVNGLGTFTGMLGDASLFKPPKFASGGLVSGPGGPRDDKVPLLASAGEFVVNAAAVQKIGVPKLQALNKGGSTLNAARSFSGIKLLKGFRDGGLVGSDRSEPIGYIPATGEYVYPEDIDDDNLRSLRERAARAKKLEEDLRNKEYRRIKDQANLPGSRLRDPALLASATGRNYVKQLPDGTLSYSDRPMNGGRRVDNSLANVPLDSRFGEEVGSREGFRREDASRVRNRKQLEYEAALAQADKIDQLKKQKAAAKTQELLRAADKKLTDNTAGIKAQAESALDPILGIIEQSKTAKGREILENEEVDGGHVTNILQDAKGNLAAVEARIKQAKKVPFTIPDFAKGHGKLEVADVMLGNIGIISPDGEIIGSDVYYPLDFLSRFTDGSLSSVVGQAAQIVKSSGDVARFGSLEGFRALNDMIATSDLSAASKGFLSFGLGATKAAAGLSLGTARLAANAAVKTGETVGSLAHGDVGTAASNAFGLAKTIASAPADLAAGALDTTVSFGRSAGELAGAIVTGQGGEEISRTAFAAGDDALNFAGTLYGGRAGLSSATGFVRRGGVSQTLAGARSLGRRGVEKLGTVVRGGAGLARGGLRVAKKSGRAAKSRLDEVAAIRAAAKAEKEAAKALADAEKEALKKSGAVPVDEAAAAEVVKRPRSLKRRILGFTGKAAAGNALSMLALGKLGIFGVPSLGNALIGLGVAAAPRIPGLLRGTKGLASRAAGAAVSGIEAVGSLRGKASALLERRAAGKEARELAKQLSNRYDGPRFGLDYGSVKVADLTGGGLKSRTRVGELDPLYKPSLRGGLHDPAPTINIGSGRLPPGNSRLPGSGTSLLHRNRLSTALEAGKERYNQLKLAREFRKLGDASLPQRELSSAARIESVTSAGRQSLPFPDPPGRAVSSQKPSAAGASHPSQLLEDIEKQTLSKLFPRRGISEAYDLLKSTGVDPVRQLKALVEKQDVDLGVIRAELYRSRNRSRDIRKVISRSDRDIESLEVDKIIRRMNTPVKDLSKGDFRARKQGAKSHALGRILDRPLRRLLEAERGSSPFSSVENAIQVASEIPAGGGRRIVTPDRVVRGVNRREVIRRYPALFKEDLGSTFAGSFASGGPILGPGGPKSDRIPILASNGEFVMNADTVRRMGVGFFDSLNKGDLPGFKDGGVIGAGSTRTNGAGISVALNTDEIARAIKQAVSDALDSSSVPLQVDEATTSITNAFTASINNAVLPKLKVDTDGVTVPLEIPTGGIPLDTSALKSLNLGENLGSAVRNRLEAVEGTVAGLREDTSSFSDLVEKLDSYDVPGLSEKVDKLAVDVEPLTGKITELDTRMEAQKKEILLEVFTLVNEQINNLQFDDDVTPRLEKHIAATDANFVSVSTRIAEAIDLANRALSQALSRN